MTERGNAQPRRPERPAGRAFVAQKRPTPTWIKVVFIGIPSVVIVVLLGLLIRKVAFSPREQVAQTTSIGVKQQEAERLFNEAVNLKKRGKELSDGGQDKLAFPAYKQALSEFNEAQGKYTEIIEEIKARLHVPELPPEYEGYNQRLHEILLHKQDCIRMISMGL